MLLMGSRNCDVVMYVVTAPVSYSLRAYFIPLCECESRNRKAEDRGALKPLRFVPLPSKPEAGNPMVNTASCSADVLRRTSSLARLVPVRRADKSDLKSLKYLKS